MKSRDVFLASTATTLLLGGAAWYLTHRLTEVDGVEPMHPGEIFPALTGTTLAGETLILPDAMNGRPGVLILADTYAAREEVSAWAAQVQAIYGDHPGLAVYLVPLISGIGSLTRRVINAVMAANTSTQEQSRVLVVYGDLRAEKRRLGLGQGSSACIVVLGPTGRLAWRAAGPPNEERIAGLAQALAAQGITPRED